MASIHADVQFRRLPQQVGSLPSRERGDLRGFPNESSISRGAASLRRRRSAFWNDSRDLSLVQEIAVQRSQKPGGRIMTKLLCASAIVLAIMTGATLAAGEKGTSALDNPEKMAPFYTDKDMKTLKSDADFKAAWMALTDDDRAGMNKECGDEAIAKEHDNFCKMTKELGGAN
jgi:hypothetical protein